MAITNNNKLSAEPWCLPAFTSKHSLLPQTVLTTVFAPVYIDKTAAINHSSTHSLRYALPILSLFLEPYRKFFFPNPQSQNTEIFKGMQNPKIGHVTQTTPLSGTICYPMAET